MLSRYALLALVVNFARDSFTRLFSALLKHWTVDEVMYLMLPFPASTTVLSLIPGGEGKLQQLVHTHMQHLQRLPQPNPAVWREARLGFDDARQKVSEDLRFQGVTPGVIQHDRKRTC